MHGKQIFLLGLFGFFTFLLNLNSANALCTLPYTLSNGQTADASQVMANLTALANCISAGAPAGSTNALQFNAGSGTFGAVAPLTNGQVAIGSTGNAPQAATLTAGSGIVITNGPGSVTIGATGGGGGSSYEAPFVPATSSTFTTQNLALGSSLASDSGGNLTLAAVVTSSNTNVVSGGTQGVPTGGATGWRADARFVVNYPIVNYVNGGIFVRNSTTGKIHQLCIGYNGAMLTNFYWNNWSSFDHQSNITGLANTDIWMRIENNGTNLNYYISRDGRSWTMVMTETLSGAYTGTPDQVGLGLNPNGSGTSAPIQGSTATLTILSWNAYAY